MAVKVETVDYGPDRILLRLEPRGPVELEDLAQSLNSFANMFERHQVETDGRSTAVTTRLYVSRIQTGSIITEIAPLMVLMNEPLHYMAAVNTVQRFSENVIRLLKKFAGDDSGSVSVTSEDVKDLQTFIKPLTGRKGAELGITHARFKSKTKHKEIVAEYVMKAPEINLAASNINIARDQDLKLLASPGRHEIRREVLMKLFQASASAGKEKGRTGDRAIIADVTDRDLPLYFPKQSNDYKRQITEETEFPFAKGYIVDVDVEYDGDMPKMYRLLNLHEVIDL